MFQAVIIFLCYVLLIGYLTILPVKRENQIPPKLFLFIFFFGNSIPFSSTPFLISMVDPSLNAKFQSYPAITLCFFFPSSSTFLISFILPTIPSTLSHLPISLRMKCLDIFSSITSASIPILYLCHNIITVIAVFIRGVSHVFISFLFRRHLFLTLVD